MKNLIKISLFAILLIAGVNYLKAENPPIFPDNLNKHLLEEVTYPDFAKEDGLKGFVLVSYTVGDDGSIDIEVINASDENLKTYVIEKLLNIRLCPYDLSVGKTFNVKFDFKLLKE